MTGIGGGKRLMQLEFNCRVRYLLHQQLVVHHTNFYNLRLHGRTSTILKDRAEEKLA
jgi:hypothetical protein